MTADADERPQLDALLVTEVEDALEQPPRGPRLGGTFREADALGDFDDAERRDLGRPPVRDPGTDADQVARGARVGEGKQDPIRRLAARRHQPSAPTPRISRQRVTRYGF